MASVGYERLSPCSRHPAPLQNLPGIQQLPALLRQHGDCLYSGRACLTLTCSTVSCINRMNQQDSSSRLPSALHQIVHNSEIEWQRTCNMMQKIPKLKVTHCGNTTLQDVVDLSTFHSVLSLELDNVPIHLIVGLRMLRDRLTTLICRHCVHELSHIFAACGGDQTSEAPWNELSTVVLSYNNLSHLDHSLMLLPSLTTLDLSHNRLINVQPLVELRQLQKVNLSCNYLTSVPILSARARGCLQSLNLNCNRIESLEGVDAFVSLHFLDVSENCLIAHSLLEPLRNLTKLEWLSLQGNPITFDKKHRVMAMSHLNRHVLSTQFVLDGKCLKKREVLMVEKNVSHWHQNNPRLPNLAEGASGNSSLEDLSCTGAGSSLSHITVIQSVALSSSKRKTRVQQIYLDSPDTPVSVNIVPEDLLENSVHVDVHCENPNPAVLPDNSLREEIEEYRKKHGDNWLVRGPEEIPSLGVVGSHNTPPFRSTPIHSELEKLNRRSQISDDVIVLSKETESSDSDLSRIDNAKELSSPSQEHGYTKHSDNRSDGVLSPETGIWSPRSYESASDDDICESNCSAPYIVDVYTPGASTVTTVIVIISGNVLKEKDSQTGSTVNRFDLRCLESVEELSPEIGFTDGSEHEYPVIRLIFNSVRKDNREREYRLEDKDNCKSLLTLLQPFAEQNAIDNMTKGALQCLRCLSQFSQGVVQGNSKLDFPADVLPLEPRQSNEENLSCPNCSSKFLIEIDVPEAASLPLSSARLRPVSVAHSLPCASILSSYLPNSRSLESTESGSKQQMKKSTQEIDFDSGARTSSQIDISQLRIEAEPHPTQSPLSNDALPKGKITLPTSNDTLFSVDSSDENSCQYLSATSSLLSSPGVITNDTDQYHGSESDITILSNPSLNSLSGTTLDASDSERLASGLSYLNLSPTLAYLGRSVSVGEGEKLLSISHILQNSSESSSDSQCSSICTAVDKKGSVSTNCNNSLNSTSDSEPGVQDILFNYDNLSIIDHRLKLHLDLNMLQGDEKAYGVIKCRVISPSNHLQLSLVAFSSASLYIMPITGPCTYDPASWLKQGLLYSLADLSEISILFGSQGVRLFFKNKKGAVDRTCIMLLRDAQRTNTLVAFLQNHVENACSLPGDHDLPVSLEADTHLVRLTETIQTHQREHENVNLYLLIDLSVFGSSAFSPCAAVVTGLHIYFLRDDFLNSDCSVLHVCPIENVTTVKTYISKCTTELTAVDEDSRVSANYTVRAETHSSSQAFLAALKTSWEATFHVELTVLTG